MRKSPCDWTALQILEETKRLQQSGWDPWYTLSEVQKAHFPELELAEQLLVQGRHDLDKAIVLAKKGSKNEKEKKPTRRDTEKRSRSK